MGREYAVTEDGKRKLIAITCDWCDARIHPYPEIASSGWMRHITAYFGANAVEVFERSTCPSCSRRA